MWSESEMICKRVVEWVPAGKVSSVKAHMPRPLEEVIGT